MDTATLRRRIAEYRSLPDDLMTRLRWIDDNPPPTLTVRCAICPESIETILLSWEDVERELEIKGSLQDEIITQGCPRCGPEEGEDETPGLPR